jgi:uncharacterized protein YcbK (DUF882 family)
MHLLNQSEKLSTHFKRSEFACKCGCGYSTPDIMLINILEDVRVYFGQPLTVNSSLRCSAHNASVGGAKNSAHMFGIAADIVVKNIPPAVVHKYLDQKYSDMYGLGKYNSFTHIDVRKPKARW